MRAINRAEPGLIRVDADETTYSLHIILRFELEQELIEGTVALEDLPEIWNARMKEFLGVDVPSTTRDGVLQDVHWSGGGIGYFPTYALGNVDLAADLGQGARGDPGSRRRRWRPASCSRCRTGCATTSTRSGRKLTPKETLARLTGSGRDRPAAVPRLPAATRWRSR